MQCFQAALGTSAQSTNGRHAQAYAQRQSADAFINSALNFSEPFAKPDFFVELRGNRHIQGDASAAGKKSDGLLKGKIKELTDERDRIAADGARPAAPRTAFGVNLKRPTATRFMPGATADENVADASKVDVSANDNGNVDRGFDDGDVGRAEAEEWRAMR
ncbi:MAG: hypothetical protein WA647_19080 [Candidatus Acidiferrum sp.]